MIDLNVRLETSLSREDFICLAKLQNIELEKDFLDLPKLGKKEDLTSYLSRRDKALSLLQSKEAINMAVQSIVHRLYREGLIYFELAFTPFYFKNVADSSLRRTVKALMNGLNDALKECPGMDGNVILYCHRDDAPKNNDAVLDLAMEYRDERIVAVGLEGDDKARQMSRYANLLKKARDNNYPIVMELGSTYNANASIMKAVALGAKRIVNPYKFKFDQNLLYTLSANNVSFEYRPTLDLVLGNNKDMDSFPLFGLWKNGINAFFSGGSYELCNASINNECRFLIEKFNFTRNDINHMLYVALNSAFLRNTHEKSRMISKFINGFDSFYKKL